MVLLLPLHFRFTEYLPSLSTRTEPAKATDVVRHKIARTERTILSFHLRLLGRGVGVSGRPGEWH
jgi:hypothetical protein